MGYFTYRNARKAAVRSKRLETLAYQQMRQEDGSGYQDTADLGRDVGDLIAAVAVFLVLPILWLTKSYGTITKISLTMVIFGALVIFPVLVLPYLVWAGLLALGWKE